MKAFFFSVVMALGLVCFGTGCHSSPKLDTTDVERAFQSSAADVKAEATKIVDAAKAKNYTNALASAQVLVGKGTLSPEEDAALQDLIGQLEKLSGKSK